MSLTDNFLQNIFQLRTQSVIDEKIERLIRSYLLDTIGVTFAGSKDLKERELCLLDLMGDNSNACVHPIGHTRLANMADTIFINGLSSHFLELDDGVRYGVIHPSAPIFSALIPLAIFYKVPWKDFLMAAICGYETGIRLATSMQPSHYKLGYHPTATCCTLSVAVSVSVMLGMDNKVVKDAFSAACISASGSLKVLEDVSQLKPYNCAKASLNGYMSAILAMSGFKGPLDPLGGDVGFLKMMSSSYKEEILIDKQNFLYLEKIYQKPYASCRHTHPEIEACLKIRKDQRFNVENIDRVQVTTYKDVMGKHDFKEIFGESSARMSIPYSVAVSLITGKAGIAEFSDPYVSNYTILCLTRKVDVVPSEDFSCLVPDKRVALVELYLKSGEIISEKVEYPKGEPENPLSTEEQLVKFLSMTSYAGLAQERAYQMYYEIVENKNPKLTIL